MYCHIFEEASEALASPAGLALPADMLLHALPGLAPAAAAAADKATVAGELDGDIMDVAWEYFIWGWNDAMPLDLCASAPATCCRFALMKSWLSEGSAGVRWPAA